MKDEIESQVIEESDVGLAESVLGLSEEATVEAPESVPEVKVEEVTDIEMGKTPEALQAKFLSLYKVLSDLGDTVDHGASSKRHHFKCGRKGFALLFYGRKPTLQLAFSDEGVKKKRLESYSISEKAVVDADGKTLTIKQIQSIIRQFKKARGF